MGVATSSNTAGADREVAAQTLNRELQDKGFLVDDGLPGGSDRGLRV